MIDDRKEVLTAEESEVLQEIMNIGFGAAAADLAQVIDIYVILSVPTIKVVDRARLLENIKFGIRDYRDVSIVEQSFWSRFKGVALLVFSGNAGKNLLSLISSDTESETDALFESDPLRVLEKETLMEVGNILVGACVGKVAELLGDAVSYSPPRVLMGSLEDHDVADAAHHSGEIVIVMEAVFHFNKQDVQGYFFIITNQESIGWLKEAIRAFMKQYE
jgi:chemotaxis protein CheC